MDQSKILRINELAAKAKTPEGLSIGSTRQDVTDALGIGEQSGDTLVYVGGSTRLTFSLRDGKVTGIHYGWIS